MRRITSAQFRVRANYVRVLKNASWCPHDGEQKLCRRLMAGIRLVPVTGTETERGELLVLRLDLLLQRLGGGGVLLDQRRVLLRLK